jgi:hypothetical protein
MEEKSIVQFGDEGQTMKRRFYMFCSTAIFGMCDSVRLVMVPVLKSIARKRIVETVID